MCNLINRKPAEFGNRQQIQHLAWLNLIFKEGMGSLREYIVFDDDMEHARLEFKCPNCQQSFSSRKPVMVDDDFDILSDTPPFEMVADMFHKHEFHCKPCQYKFLVTGGELKISRTWKKEARHA